MKPLCIELFAGMFGFSAGWLEIGGRAIGFDIEHLPHHGPVPDGAELVLQDVRTLSGSQFKNASLILASPPCTEFSYMAMPWKRAKQIASALRGDGEFPRGYSGSKTIKELKALFDACFRIQREASEAAGHHVPMVVENVKGAQPWVGRAKGHYGSYYLWGDVPALMPIGRPQKIIGYSDLRRNDGKGSHLTSQRENDMRKNSGGSCSAIGSPGQKEVGRNPVTGNWVKQHGSGPEWFDNGIARHSSRSSARKAASASIAKIPFALAQHIARAYKPEVA